LFLVYGLAFIGAWVGQIGALLQSEGAVRVGMWTRLLLPVEALWRRAASLLTPPLPLPVSPFTGGSAPGEAMVLYALAYAIVALGLAAWAFERRDL
ncbi:MAG: ABC transporter permease, partial [Gemmatimonadetes bacterium]|nr:ABC transporter permease [Gemmatimonadota bacterium]